MSNLDELQRKWSDAFKDAIWREPEIVPSPETLIIEQLKASYPPEVRNPYIEQLHNIVIKGDLSGQSQDRVNWMRFALTEWDRAKRVHAFRSYFVREFAFAIPTNQILNLVAACGPIMEIGAGSGYWAYCLDQMECDVICYDAFQPADPETTEFTRTWFEIRTDIEEGLLTESAGRSLLICWPDDTTRPWTRNTLQKYINAGGRTLIYIGLADRARCAAADFFELAHDNFELSYQERLPAWETFQDYMLIYRRL